MTNRLIDDLNEQIVRAAMADRRINPWMIGEATKELASMSRRCDPRSEMERMVADHSNFLGRSGFGMNHVPGLADPR